MVDLGCKDLFSLNLCFFGAKGQMEVTNHNALEFEK